MLKKKNQVLYSTCLPGKAQPQFHYLWPSVFRPSSPLPESHATGFWIRCFLPNSSGSINLVRLLFFLRPEYPLLYKSFSDILDNWSFFPLQFHFCFHFLEVLITLYSNYLPTWLLLLLDSDLFQKWQRSCISVFLIPNHSNQKELSEIWSNEIRVIDN